MFYVKINGYKLIIPNPSTKLNKLIKRTDITGKVLQKITITCQFRKHLINHLRGFLCFFTLLKFYLPQSLSF